MHSPLADDNVETVRSERECRKENRVTKRTPRLTDTKCRDYTVVVIQNKILYRHSSLKQTAVIFILPSFAYSGSSEVNKLWVPIRYALYRFCRTELLCCGYLDPDDKGASGNWQCYRWNCFRDLLSFINDAVYTVQRWPLVLYFFILFPIL